MVGFCWLKTDVKSERKFPCLAVCRQDGGNYGDSYIASKLGSHSRWKIMYCYNAINLSRKRQNMSPECFYPIIQSAENTLILPLYK